jgi:photosystem II stability/assembly factor-like uncharacterized protein
MTRVGRDTSVRFVTRVLTLLTLGALLAACSSAAPPRHHSAAPSTTTTSALPSSISSPTTSTTTPSPPPSNLPIDDLTWISATHGWALVGSTNCAEPKCAEVLTTTDGGSTWSEIGWIPLGSNDCPGGCNGNGSGVTHIRFANAMDGYAYDPDLFVTTDGGQFWSKISGPMVAALEPDGSSVMRVAYTQTGCPGPCDLTIETAPAGSESWVTVHAPFQGDSVQLIRQGNAAYVATFQNPAGGAGNAQATLLLSTDNGETWTSRPDPCSYTASVEYDTEAITAAPGGVIVALCQQRGGGMHDYVALSANGGTTFLPQPAMPGTAIFGSIAAASASDLVVAGGTNGQQPPRTVLYDSRDGGRTWEMVASQAATSTAAIGFVPPTYLGFESASVGRWASGTDLLFQTSDGGLTWPSTFVEP